MKKLLFLFMLTLSVLSIHAKDVRHHADSLYLVESGIRKEVITPLRPTYLKNVIETSNWGSNWFIEAKGGASAFLGTPVGCGDLFNRVKPVLQVGIGKWFTPAIGGRIGYQGLEFKNADLITMKYQFVHADFMYNLTGNFHQDDDGISRWDVIPFIGIGMIRNSTPSMTVGANPHVHGNHPFAFSYGIQARYHVHKRLHIIGEVFGITTLQNFDGVGQSGRFGDNMLNVSAGLSFTVGKHGWKKVIDARPYIQQNNYLIDKLNTMMLNDSQASNEDYTTTPRSKNDYSGLNSLRYRMSLNHDDDNSLGNGSEHSDSLLLGGNSTQIALGVPVYFYFKINTDELVDKAQLSNLSEIAKLCIENNANIKISGAADSATGTDQINRELSVARAKYIAKELVRLGVDKANIKAVSLGGIDEFSPIEANRNTCVIVTK